MQFIQSPLLCRTHFCILITNTPNLRSSAQDTNFHNPTQKQVKRVNAKFLCNPIRRIGAAEKYIHSLLTSALDGGHR